jgi:glycosyltransferase involved in cell wall biosynthesis
MATTDRLRPAHPIRVLYILDEFTDPHAGTEGQFWLLINGLDRQAVRAGVLLLRPSAYLAEHLPRDIPLEVLDVERLASARSLWRIVCAILRARRAGYQMAHIYFNDCAIVFPWLLKLAGLRVIVSRRDLGFWYTPRNLRILRANARAVDAVIANCNAVKREVVRAEGFPQHRVSVIYNGVARTANAPDENSRAGPELPDDARRVVLVANLRPLKRVDDAVRIMALIAKQVSGVHLIVVGEDREGHSERSHRNELEVLARSLGIDDQIHFTGKLADPMRIIRTADVCLLCSETEGLSNACGRSRERPRRSSRRSPSARALRIGSARR